MDIHEAKDAIFEAAMQWQRLLLNSWQDRAAAEWHSLLKDDSVSENERGDLLVEAVKDHLTSIVMREHCRSSGGFTIGHALEQYEADLAREQLRMLRWSGQDFKIVMRWVDVAKRRHESKPKPTENPTES